MARDGVRNAQLQEVLKLRSIQVINGIRMQYQENNDFPVKGIWN